MQNRYVGDIGDFGKYGLLRWLCGMHRKTANDGYKELKLGVVWYLNTDGKNSDGNIRKYLEDRKGLLQQCDSPLYESLKPTLQEENRNVTFIKDCANILPGAKFFDPCVFGGPSASEERGHWLKKAQEKVKSCDLVFIDPDNGIASQRLVEKISRKHAFYSEIKSFSKLCSGKSLVIYHHASRRPAAEEIRTRSAELTRKLGLPVRSLWYHRGTARFYFVAMQPAHNETILSRLTSFGRSEWCTCPHFTLVPEEI